MGTHSSILAWRIPWKHACSHFPVGYGRGGASIRPMTSLVLTRWFLTISDWFNPPFLGEAQTVIESQFDDKGLSVTPFVGYCLVFNRRIISCAFFLTSPPPSWGDDKRTYTGNFYSDSPLSSYGSAIGAWAASTVQRRKAPEHHKREVPSLTSTGLQREMHTGPQYSTLVLPAWSMG